MLRATLVSAYESERTVIFGEREREWESGSVKWESEDDSDSQGQPQHWENLYAIISVIARANHFP